MNGAVVKALVIGMIPFLLPAACMAIGPNLGAIMFLGDSITVGADGSNSGYRGFFIQNYLNPAAGNHGVFPAPTGNQATFTVVGTSQQDGSTYLQSLDTPGFSNPYLNNEGHSGTTIDDLYSANNSDTNQMAQVAFNQIASTSTYTPGIPYSASNPYTPLKFVYLMIGSNNPETTPAQITQSLADELSLISYIKSVDTGLSRILVEPPPEFPKREHGRSA